MGDRERFEDYTRRLTKSAASNDDVVGLVLLGSTAAVDRVDEWSDHDFYLVVREGQQERFRSDLGLWLPDVDEIAFAVRETEHGLKVVYSSGAVLEFAVASLDEVSTFGGSPYAVVLDRADLTERMASGPAIPAPREVDALREFRLFLSLLLIGVGRARRGEELAGGQLVRTYALERLLTVLREQLGDAGVSGPMPDPFNVFRRFEQTHPVIGRELGDALAAPVDACGLRLLDIAEQHLRPAWTGFPTEEVDVVRSRLA